MIFICGIHKSGTSLLRNLLDGHPQLNVIPFESHFFELLGSNIEYVFRKQNHINRTNKEFVNEAIRFVTSQNQHEDKLSDSVIGKRINIDLFSRLMQKAIEIKINNTPDLFAHYLTSISKSFNSTYKANNAFVEKSVENMEFAFELFHYYPNAKFIHIVRNPYSNIVSLRKYKHPIGPGSIVELISALKYNQYHLYNNLRRIPNYFLVRYEDLVVDSEKTIKNICRFLNLQFDPTLLNPTSGGIHWTGNSTHKQPLNGIDMSILNEWESQINPLEVYYVNLVLSNYLKDMGYSLIQNKGFWLPLAKEKFKTYFRNRFYRIFS